MSQIQKPYIACVGEILCDLIGEAENERMHYSSYAGGAPFNVACGIEKLGGAVGFIGSVGEDPFGDFLQKFAQNRNFSFLNIMQDKPFNTTLAVVSIDSQGERSFAFCRENSADYHMKVDKKAAEYIKSAFITHLGTLMLSKKEGRTAAKKTIRTCKKAQTLISMDVNYRDDIYESAEEAKKIICGFLKYADIIKVSESELYYLSGENTLEKAATKIKDFCEPLMLCVSMGDKGSVCFYNNRFIYADAIKVTPIDTTGAGDAFFAGFLYQLLQFAQSGNDIKNLSNEQIGNVLRFSNICGALATTQKGALSAQPNLKEVKNLLEKQL